MNGNKLAQSKASFVVFRWATVGVETVIQIGRRFWGAECLVEVGRFAVGSVSGVVFGRGRKTCENNSPMTAVVDGHSLVSDGERERRLTARALWLEKHEPTARCRKPLSGRWVAAIRLAALRPMVVVKLVDDSKQAAVVVKGGGAQSRSLVGTFQGKGGIRRKAV